MAEFLETMSRSTPTILFAVLFLAVAVAFFIYYWFAVAPRKHSLEWIALSEARARRFSFPVKRHPMTRVDILPLVLITLLYSCTAFYRLGDLESVQSSVTLTEGQSVSFTLSEATDVSQICFYTVIGTGSYTLEYTCDGETWQSVQLEQPYNSLLKWRTVEEETDGGETQAVSITGKIFRLTAHPHTNSAHPDREFLELGELALLDANGDPIPIVYVEEEGAALFDEQALVADYFWTNSSYFDEIYHVRTAQEHLDNVYPYEVSHPPLGKLIIALGISIFGLNPFGWRFMGALFGVLMLPLLYVFLKNLFGRTATAVCGTTLFAAEFMHLTQTRIATIDTYGVFFILASYFFLYRWLTVPPNVKLRRSVPSLFLCGLSFGIGVACKWTVIYAGAGLALLWLLGLIFKGKAWSRGSRPRFAPYLWGTVGLSLLFFVALPAVIYVASYLPYASAAGETTLSGLLKIVWDNQVFMLTYHQGVDTPHPYESRWYQWLVDARPILYFREMDAVPGMKAAFSSFNNPLISWGGLLCVILTAVETFRRKCGRALFILVGYLAQLLPWVFISRITFAYHYFPSILFCVLAISYAMDQMLARRRAGCRLAVYGFTGCAVLLYAAFYPVLIGLYVPTWYTYNFLRWLPSWPI